MAWTPRAVKQVIAFELFGNIVHELAQAVAGLKPGSTLVAAYWQVKPAFLTHFTHLERLEARLYGSDFYSAAQLRQVVRRFQELAREIYDIAKDAPGSVHVEFLSRHRTARDLAAFDELNRNFRRHWMREQRDAFLAGAEQLLGISK